MSIEMILALVFTLVFGGGYLAFIYTRHNTKASFANSEKVRSSVERFGYCSKTPQGWGFWLLKIEGRKEAIKILPHLHKNHEEIALTKAGDKIEVEFYYNEKEKEWMALSLINSSFRSS